MKLRSRSRIMEHQDGEQDDVTTFRTSISEVISHKTIIVPGDTSSKNAILHDDEQLQSAMERVKSLSSPATLQDLIESLRKKLNLVTSAEHEHDYRQLNNKEPAGPHPSLPQTTSSSSSSSSFHPKLLPILPPTPDHSNGSPHGSIYDRDDVGDSSTSLPKSLNSDTIILVGSLIVMILIGLVFHRVISYFAQLRSRRRQYHGGLKQLGEHMHVVTRTISNPGTPIDTPIGTPSFAMRKLAAINNNRLHNGCGQSTPELVKKSGAGRHKISVVPDDDNSVFKPSTHVMRRDESSIGVMTTAAQIRHQEELRRVPSLPMESIYT